MLHEYSVEFASVLDLTDARLLTNLELTVEHLVDDDRALTQQLGELAHQFGYLAFLSSSATGVDAVLAVFTDNLRSGRLEPRIAEQWEMLTDL